MRGPADSFVAEDFLRATKGDVALWVAASLIVSTGLFGGYWAYQAFVPVDVAAGPPAGAIVVEFAEFAVSPATEELDVPEGDPSMAAEATPPSEAEPEEEAEPIDEPEPVETEPEPEPEETAEPPQQVAEAKPVPEPVTEPEPVAEPDPAPVAEPEAEPEPPVLPGPEEPVIDVPEVEVPEPAVVIERAAEPAPSEPVVEPVDPNLPVPVTMSARIAETRANTPQTKFTPPPRRAPPPQQAASLAAAPKPQEQQAQQAAAPQQSISSEPSASQVNRWESGVLRHLGQRRKYPSDARQRGEEGRVVVQFSIDVGGNVLSVSIARSSGFASLDQAALELVRASSPVPRPPEGLPKSRLNIAMPIDYGG